MAEYYAVLSKAVGGLDANNPDARRAVYDKARNALIGQLKAIDPPLPTAEISRQRLELEEAIRRVERETSAMPAGAPVKVAPPPKPAPPPPAAEAAPAPAPRQTPAPPRQSPADVFRRAIQEAEHRDPADEPPRVERAPVAARADAGWSNARAERATPPPPPPIRQPDPYQPPKGYVDPAPAAADETSLAPDYDNEWEQQELAEPALRVDARERPKPQKAARRPQRRAPARTDDLGEDIEGAARPSRLPTIVLGILIVAMLGALGAFGWSQRDMIADIVNSYDGPAAPAPEAAAPAVADVSGKDTDRLLGDQQPAESADVRVVAPATPPGGEAASASGNALALQAPEPPPAAPAIDADALVAQRGALYEEPAEANADVVPVNADVTWSYVENGPNGPEVVGNVNVPDRGMKFKVTIRRNIDDSLPASHIVEIMVDAPADRPVREIPRIVFKPSEEGRGTQLIGAPAQVAPGFFWIALSNVPADVNANLNLLNSQLWIDLPFVYENGRRAILTIEKGTPGERVFARALTAWTG